MSSLSRLFSAGRLVPFSNKCNIHTRSTLLAAAPATSNRCAESVKRAEDISKKYATHVDEAVSRWAKSDEVYYGKERDMKNFPPVEYAEVHPKVRLGFIPDSWFQTLYSKTGVTDSWVDNEEKVRYHEPLNKVKGYLDKTIETSEEEMARLAAVPALIRAKEENLDLQLEAAYRERLQHVHRAVVHRLDYHMERETARRRFQQHHLVEWVVDHVVKGITPAQEKDTLTQCIAGLRRLAQQGKTATSTA